MKSPPVLILASSSVYRRQLLSRLQLPFECAVPGVDESPRPGERARVLVARLAKAKAHAIAVQHPDAWVIGSDQVAVLGEAPEPQTIPGEPASSATEPQAIPGKPASVAAEPQAILGKPGSDAAESQAILGKPGSAANCIDQLIKCSGRTLAFVTAVAVMRHRDASLTEFIDTTRVVFRPLERAAIERYVERESPLDCAGGFKSEGLGITLCDALDSSDPTALIGLPLIRLCAILRRVGFDLP